MSELQARLERLAEAVASLEDAPGIVRLAALALGSALPRCFVRSYASPGLVQRGCGLVAHAYSGELVDGEHGAPAGAVLPIVRRLAATGALWREAVRERYLAAGELGALFAPLAPARLLKPKEWGLYVAAAGGSALAGAHVIVPERAPEISDGERAKLVGLLAELAGPLRLASLMAHSTPAQAALDELLAARPEALLVASEDGTLIGASAGGSLYLESHPHFAPALRAALRTARPRRPTPLLLPGIDARVFVSPCGRRGASTALLVQIAGDAPAAARLSRRQAELLDLLDAGLANKEIAARMGLSPATVKSMLERLYQRAGVGGRVALLAWARRGLDAPSR